MARNLQLLTRRELSQKYGLSEYRISRDIKSGKLPVVCVSERVYVRDEEAALYAENSPARSHHTGDSSTKLSGYHVLYKLAAPDGSAYIGQTCLHDGDEALDAVDRRYAQVHSSTKVARKFSRWFSSHDGFQKITKVVLQATVLSAQIDELEKSCIFHSSTWLPLANTRHLAPNAIILAV